MPTPGAYVLRTALSVAEGPQKDLLVTLVTPFLVDTRKSNSMYNKHLVPCSSHRDILPFSLADQTPLLRQRPLLLPKRPHLHQLQTRECAPLRCTSMSIPISVSPHSQVSDYVVFSYDAAEDNELSFREGDRITEIEAASEDWWQGKDKEGNVGLFPGESDLSARYQRKALTHCIVQLITSKSKNESLFKHKTCVLSKQ